MAEISDEEYQEYLALRERYTNEIVPGSNPEFIQFYKEHLPQIQWLVETNGLAAAIWLFLVRGMDTRNMVIVSNQTMQDEFGVSRQSVSKAISFLRKHGFLTVHKVGSANAYSINHDLVWQRSQKEKMYAFDTARVIFSEKEQVGLPSSEDAMRKLDEIGRFMEEREKKVQAARSKNDVARERIIKNEMYNRKRKALREKKEIGE